MYADATRRALPPRSRLAWTLVVEFGGPYGFVVPEPFDPGLATPPVSSYGLVVGTTGRGRNDDRSRRA